MKWNHLPHDGGLFNQSPDLLDRFAYIFNERNKEQAKEQERQRQKQNRKR